MDKLPWWGNDKLRARAIQHFRLYWCTWWIVFAALVLVRAFHLVATPWGIVLAPLWFPPALLIGCGLAKLALRFVGEMMLSVLE